MHDSFLSIKNICKTYSGPKGSFYALENVNCTIQRGEIFGLLGINGAGKTTLSSLLATLHPPTSGDILLNGHSIYNDIYEYRKILGYCPQYANLDMQLNVKENLLFAGRYQLMPEQKIKQRIEFLFDQFNLHHYASFAIPALSGGNKQKVLISRALMHEPNIIILDEPTVGLDPDIRRKLWDLIRQLKDMGMTIILTTHYLDEAEYLSDRICVLHKGRIILIEDMATLKQERKGKKLEDIFIDIMHEQEGGHE